MANYIRRFLTEPTEQVLLEIESVNIVDLEPPATINGVGTGKALIVGEFENGPFNTPTEVTSASDLQNIFGSLGYTVNGTIGNNACAVSRAADGGSAEKWNGNAFIQLNGKKFAGLVCTRVDTSVGTVSFSRCSYITGAAAFVYNLEPSQTLVLNVGASDLTTTFTGTAAVTSAAGGVYPTTFVGFETLTLAIDSQPSVTVIFQAADQTVDQVVSRINSYFNFTLASNNAGQLRLTSRLRGSSARVQVVAGSTGVLTKLGLTAATSSGSGNCADIDQVTFAEIKSAVETAVTSVRVDQDSQGRLRITNKATPLTGTIVATAASTATALGFTLGVTDSSAATGIDGVLPAGTIVTNSGATAKFVTMQDVVITSTNAGPYAVKVRPATDDGTSTSATAGTINVMTSVPDVGSFTCANNSLLNAALSESTIDALYQDALDSTLDANSVASECSIIWSARQSNALRKALKQNVIDASANGLLGRVACVRPPMNTIKSVALSTSSQPGVGATRDQRVIYCYPNANTYVPLIAKRGLAGGNGFTADGNIDVGWDGFVASILSQLPPEENPGQSTDFTIAVNGMESGLASQKLSMTDYKNFKAQGIAALRMDSGVAVIQSGVTSVDPKSYPSLKNINRRRIADFIEDSLARRLKSYGKKLNTPARRKAMTAEVRAFLSSLLSANLPSAQRIAGFTIDDKTANTVEVLSKGRFRLIVNVKTLSSLESIELAVTAGESVIVETT